MFFNLKIPPHLTESRQLAKCPLCEDRLMWKKWNNLLRCLCSFQHILCWLGSFACWCLGGEDGCCLFSSCSELSCIFHILWGLSLQRCWACPAAQREGIDVPTSHIPGSSLLSQGNVCSVWQGHYQTGQNPGALFSLLGTEHPSCWVCLNLNQSH